VPLTQLSPSGIPGRRYGSFNRGRRPLTQHSPSAIPMRRYGDFSRQPSAQNLFPALSGFPWWRPFYVWKPTTDWDKFNDELKKIANRRKKKKKKRAAAGIPVAIKLTARPVVTTGARRLDPHAREAMAKALRARRKAIERQNQMILLDLL
jgi:hypothetical protein